jgi:hypothetical protein
LPRGASLRGRARRRSARERGAALFIVVMVMAVLSAIGVFAVRGASLLEMAAGYDRKATQARYVSEFGLRMVVADLAGREDDYTRLVTSGASRCVTAEALRDLVPTGTQPPCFAIDHQELGNRTWAGREGRFLGRVLRPGMDATGEAAFRVEITDLGPAPRAKAGMDLSSQNFKHRQVTMTATGQVRPTVMPGDRCDEATVQASSVQAVRSHVTYMSSN